MDLKEIDELRGLATSIICRLDEASADTLDEDDDDDFDEDCDEDYEDCQPWQPSASLPARPKFGVGDVVMLKSCGNAMTINRFISGDAIQVVWHNDNGDGFGFIVSPDAICHFNEDPAESSPQTLSATSRKTPPTTDLENHF